MPRIQNTNLVIDDFSIAKRDNSRSYTHILTHVHTDHLKGLYDGWNFGDIYCTHQTARLLLLRFPSLICLKRLDYNTPTVVRQSESLEVTITLMDANHMSGSAIALIEGYMGTVLYTGDLRFDRQVFENYSHLYPPELANRQFVKCSKHIDVLYLDNTFLKPKFKFPPRKVANQMLLKHIEKLLQQNKYSRIFIALDSIGKEEAVEAVARHFEMLVAVDESRYETLEAMGYDLELFTTNPKESVVEVIRKNTLYERLISDTNATGIILSGWVNSPSFRFDYRIHCIPYSLHSSFDEIHAFLASICPSELYPIVQKFPDQNKLFYSQSLKGSKHDLMFNQQLFETTSSNYSEELDELRRLYCGSPMSREYYTLLNNVEVARRVEKELRRSKGLVDLGGNEKCSNSINIPGMQTGKSKRYRLGGQRNEQSINRLRNQIELKKIMQNGYASRQIEIIDSGEEKSPFSQYRQNGSVIEIDEDEECFTLEREEKKFEDPLFGNSTSHKLKMNMFTKEKEKVQENARKSQEIIQPIMEQNKVTSTNKLDQIRILKEKAEIDDYLRRKFFGGIEGIRRGLQKS